MSEHGGREETNDDVKGPYVELRVYPDGLLLGIHDNDDSTFRATMAREIGKISLAFGLTDKTEDDVDTEIDPESNEAAMASLFLIFVGIKDVLTGTMGGTRLAPGDGDHLPDGMRERIGETLAGLRLAGMMGIMALAKRDREIKEAVEALKSCVDLTSEE